LITKTLGGQTNQIKGTENMRHYIHNMYRYMTYTRVHVSGNPVFSTAVNSLPAFVSSGINKNQIATGQAFCHYDKLH